MHLFIYFKERISLKFCLMWREIDQSNNLSGEVWRQMQWFSNFLTAIWDVSSLSDPMSCTSFFKWLEQQNTYCITQELKEKGVTGVDLSWKRVTAPKWPHYFLAG